MQALTQMPTQMPTQVLTRSPQPRPYFDPDTVREPEKICPQQRREQGWEGV